LFKVVDLHLGKIFFANIFMEKTALKKRRKLSTGKKLSKSVPSRPSNEKDLSIGYNNFKNFDGQQYTGMKVGRSHKWYYDKGEWKETKITPDLWQISYAVTKRRAGKAPEGSGVPVGTAYHWYILAHQDVKKINANDYLTSMSGIKYKLAHKRVDKEKWSASAKTQRKHLINFLKEIIMQLEKEPLPIEFEYNEKVYKGEGMPLSQTCQDDVCEEFDITLNDEHFGIIRRMKNGWKMNEVQDKKFINAIGKAIETWYGL
jgi:hypothetical protein